MNKHYSFIRLVVCYTVCVFFMVYCFYGTLQFNNKTTPTFTDIFIKNTEKSDKNTEKTEKAEKNSSKDQKTAEKTESVSSKTQKSESVAVSNSAIKGKIVTRYISPYKAPQSYGGVYIKNSTGTSVNIKQLLYKKLDFKIEKNSSPQVLIIHTHTTETFMQKDAEYYTADDKARTTDNNKNMAKIGSIIAKKLNDNGIKTIHDTTKHDYPEYTGSYTRAAKTITSYLKKYPSIKIVLDLHRDSVSADGGKAKLVTQINGKNAAQVMLVMGSQTGGITGFPNWKENLSLAFKLQQTIEAKYPTLARPLMLASKKYNESLSKGSLLIEFGTEANTLSEATYSAELVGNSLVSLLNTLK